MIVGLKKEKYGIKESGSRVIKGVSVKLPLFDGHFQNGDNAIEGVSCLSACFYLR